MSTQFLLEDVNLSEIHFTESARSIVFEFLNMSDGAMVAKLVCEGIAFFQHSIDPDYSLPAYIGEVTREAILDASTARDTLSRVGFGFVEFSGMRLVDDQVGLVLVRLEGEVSLEIICRNAKLDIGGEKSAISDSGRDTSE